MNHPNRSRRKDAPALVPPHNRISHWVRDCERGKSPNPEEIRKLRAWATLTKPEMAQLLHMSLRAYEEWEAGRQTMHPNHWLAMRCAVHVVMWRMSEDRKRLADEALQRFAARSE